MIVLNLLRHLAARQGPFLALCGGLFALFHFLICAAVSSANVGAALETLLRSLPPSMQNLVTTQFFGGLSERGLVAFGWNHPVSQAIGTAVAIVLAARVVAGEIESGAAELLFSQPLARGTYFVTHVLFTFFSLGLLSLAGVVGTCLGQAAFEMPLFSTGALLTLALDYFLLQTAWYGIALAFSSSGHDGGRVAGIGFLLAVASFFAQAIGRLWSDAAFVLPWTLHHYFSPQTILVESGSPWRLFLVLSGVTAAGIALAAWRFHRRDLP